jgi:alkanesulfonate monooxygenase SsuD/methylene tetrahydromethanopterin reductase-like flavin-dependent oxidoreductase (luciferase family)
VKLGAYFLPQDLPVFVESARCAERCGYARAWVIDGQMLYHDLYVYLDRGLTATERLVFGPGVTNPVTRHDTVTAGAIATLDQLHPGRVILGLGRGDNAVLTIGGKPMRTAEYAEAVPRLRALVAGEPVIAGGTEMRIRWAAQRVPIMLAASGPRNLRLAGALADIVQIQVGVQPEVVGWAIGLIRAGAEEAGRDPDAVEVSLLTAMWVADDLAEARRACRWSPPSVANHVESAMRNPDHGMPSGLTRVVEARRAHAAGYDYYRDHGDSTADEMDWLTDKLLDDFSICGPPARCLAVIRELQALGVREVATAFLNGQVEQMERVGREVIPVLAT